MQALRGLQRRGIPDGARLHVFVPQIELSRVHQHPRERSRSQQLPSRMPVDLRTGVLHGIRHENQSTQEMCRVVARALKTRPGDECDSNNACAQNFNDPAARDPSGS
jgi:hypothetical protein